MQIITCLANLRGAATYEVFATLCAAMECACPWFSDASVPLRESSASPDEAAHWRPDVGAVAPRRQRQGAVRIDPDHGRFRSGPLRSSVGEGDIGMRGPRRYGCLTLGILILLAMIGLTDVAQAQTATVGLPLPPGDIITGPIFRRNGTSVPSISTGADANTYLSLAPPTESFTLSAPTVVIRTSVPTQYVRAFTAGVTNPVGGFIAGSNAVRGLNAAQIRDVLALPFQPDSLTIVQIPDSTCMIVGQAAPILGNFAANPPSIPTPGPWGRGGIIQEDLIGVTSNPGCAGPQFVPAGNYGTRQLIGASALSYRLRAGGGNAFAVAAALDLATFPALFTDMDGIYNSLDLINIGNPGPLQSALVQLDGEAYADTPTVAIEAARMFLGAVHGQMRLDRGTAEGPNDPPVQEWLSGFGGGGGIGGSGDTHGISYTMGGVAGGVEHRFDPTLLAGIAVGYIGSGHGTNGISSSGSVNTFSTALYASYSPGNWYVDGALGYGYNFGTVNRGIYFPGVARGASGSPNANDFLSSVEAGYHVPLGERTVVSPFAAMQGIGVFQNRMTERGAGAIDLNVQSQTTASARSVLGAELTHGLPVGLSAPLLLTLRVGWGHEFADVSRTITASFVGLPGAGFTVNGVRVPRDTAVIGIGASLAVVQSADLFLRYDGALASGASMQAGTVGLHVTF
jgi:outer membrane autotransporter protein